jgi:NADH-quinone oxidoreductase subunit M
MNEIATGFPILTLLTVLPLVGAAIALFAGKARARRRACHFARLPVLSLSSGSACPPTEASASLSASMGALAGHRVSPRRRRPRRAHASAFRHRHAHVGRRSHRVHHMPGLFYGLILIARIGSLRFLHRAQFLPLVFVLGAEPHPRILPHQIVGRPARGPAATQFFVYTMAGSVALLLSFLAIFLSTGRDGLRRSHGNGRIRRADADGHGASGRGDALARHRRARRLRGQSAAVPFHTWLPAAYAEAPSPVTMLLTGAMSKMGVYGLLRIALPIFGADRRDAHAAARSRRHHRRDGRVGRGRAKDLKRVFAYSSVNHLGYCLLGIFALAVPTTAQRSRPARPPRSTASSCRCSITASPRPPSSGSSP